MSSRAERRDPRNGTFGIPGTCRPIVCQAPTRLTIAGRCITPSGVMEHHFFAIPALDPARSQDELNRFCAERRVVSVDRQFVAAGQDSFWAICVAIAVGQGPLPDALKAPERRSAGRGSSPSPARVDYKDVLSEADFALYADLRSWRKEAAEQEGVQVYNVFTNEQLAEIVRRRADTLAQLGEIDGIGRARLDRYGAAILTRLRGAAEGQSQTAVKEKS